MFILLYHLSPTIIIQNLSIFIYIIKNLKYKNYIYIIITRQKFIYLHYYNKSLIYRKIRSISMSIVSLYEVKIYSQNL